MKINHSLEGVPWFPLTERARPLCQRKGYRMNPNYRLLEVWVEGTWGGIIESRILGPQKRVTVLGFRTPKGKQPKSFKNKGYLGGRKNRPRDCTIAKKQDRPRKVLRIGDSPKGLR